MKTDRQLQWERINRLCELNSFLDPDGSVPKISQEPISYWKNNQSDHEGATSQQVSNNTGNPT